MDELLVTLCRNATLGPLALGMPAGQVEKHIGQPKRVNLVQGHDCWQRYLYRGALSLFFTCHEPAAQHQGPAWHSRHLLLNTITIDVVDGNPPEFPAPIAPGSAGSLTSWRVDDMHRLLAANGIEMTRDDSADDRTLSRDLDHAHVHISSTVDDGFWTRIEADWTRPVSARRIHDSSAASLDG